MNTPSDGLTTRRDFLKLQPPSAARSPLPAILTGCASAKTRPAATIKFDKTLRIGLVGCGGRGSGAADEALSADKNVELTAMGDAFENQLQHSLKTLQGKHPDKVKVTPDKCFVGLDAYQKSLIAVWTWCCWRRRPDFVRRI